MARKVFNPIAMLFQDMLFQKNFITMNPQCKDCHHVNALSFHQSYYDNFVKIKMCINCKNYTEGESDE